MISCPRCGEQNADTARFCSNCANPLAPSQAPSEVRKTVTVMFMDVVGSTGLGETTDPEAMRRVMTRYFDDIRAIVERHGGTVEKYIGDAVMAVFGVPAVHEDDALRAVRAATEIRDRLTELDAAIHSAHGMTVSWRTGINTGEVVAGDASAGQRFVTGDAVNVAARLEQAAQPGEILLGSETHRLVRDAVAVEAVPPIAVKGKTEAITAHRLVGLVDSVSAGQAGRRLDSPMIGRLRQQRLLAQAFEQVVDERVCHLFTILGAAGVGKSRLVGEFLSSLGGTAKVVHGRCLSYGEGITYWAIADAIREMAAISEDDSDEEVRSKLGELVDDDARGQVVELIGALLGRFVTAGSAEETSWAVRVLFESVARRAPVVLVLDDVQWASPPLLDLIEHLADWVHDAALLVLCVARQELLELRPGWGGGKSYATTLTLEPLNESESRELMVNLLGHVELGSELIDKIAQAAEGNPLFVEEMIAMLIDNEYLVRRDDGRWAAAGNLTEVTVPPSIQALLAARLDRLPRPERAVIERGAVEGKVFHRSAVAELAPDDVRESVSALLRALSRKELVRPDRSDFVGDEAFRFRHLLIRDAAYTAMPKAARAELHARFAAWLERVAGDHVSEYQEILGYHLAQAYRYRVELAQADAQARAIADSAARHFSASGGRALARGDVVAAIKLLESAAELISRGDPDRVRVVAELAAGLVLANEPRRADELLRDVAEEARAAGDELTAARAEVGRIASRSALGSLGVQEVIDRCEELLEIFERHGDEWGRERALFELGRHYFFAGRSRDADVLLTQLLERLPDGEVAARHVGFILATLYWGPTPVPEAIARGENLAGRALGPVMESLRQLHVGGLRGMAGELNEGIAMMRQSITIREQLAGKFLTYAGAGHHLGPLLVLAGRYEEAERVMLAAYAGMAEAGDLAFSSTVAGHLADLYVRLGRFGEAERWARVTLETSSDDDVEAQAQGLAALARVHGVRGELREAEAEARRAVAIAEGTDYLNRRGFTLGDLAEVLLADGRRDEAIEALRAAIQNFEAKGATAYANRARERLAQMAG